MCNRVLFPPRGAFCPFSYSRRRPACMLNLSQVFCEFPRQVFLYFPITRGISDERHLLNIIHLLNEAGPPLPPPPCLEQQGRDFPGSADVPAGSTFPFPSSSSRSSCQHTRSPTQPPTTVCTGRPTTATAVRAWSQTGSRCLAAPSTRGESGDPGCVCVCAGHTPVTKRKC